MLLYSDAVESIINVVASVAALIAVWYGARPADESHPYGHHKAECPASAPMRRGECVKALVTGRRFPRRRKT